MAIFTLRTCRICGYGWSGRSILPLKGSERQPLKQPAILLYKNKSATVVNLGMFIYIHLPNVWESVDLYWSTRRDRNLSCHQSSRESQLSISSNNGLVSGKFYRKPLFLPPAFPQILETPVESAVVCHRSLGFEGIYSSILHANRTVFPFRPSWFDKVPG